MAEIGTSTDAAWNTGAIETLKEAVAAKRPPAGVRWVDALSTNIRPVITYWFMTLYCKATAAAFAAAVTAGATCGVAILNAWTDGNQAFWAGALNFWFLGPVFNRRRHCFVKRALQVLIHKTTPIIYEGNSQDTISGKS